MLKALVDGVRTIACDLDQDGWSDLQREDHVARRRHVMLIQCVGCGGSMHTRRLPAPYLTQAFAHDPGGAARCHLGAGESPEHQGLKAVVFHSVKKVPGWMADVEAPFGSDVVVDVLAEKVADRTRAGRQGFEIQLATSTTGDILERQERRTSYLAQSHWLVRSQPAWMAKVPCYQVARHPETGAELVIGGVVRLVEEVGYRRFEAVDPFPVETLTRQVLRDRLAFVEDIGLIDSRDVGRARRPPARRGEGGLYVAEECNREPVRRQNPEVPRYLSPQRALGSQWAGARLGECTTCRAFRIVLNGRCPDCDER